jgi:deoxyadenosine/deoxycytidine kinase
MAPVILSVEGNIGSGKSTFVQNLKENFARELPETLSICFLQEPVDEWDKIRDSSGKTILERYYHDPEAYAFTFQMMAYITRLNRIKEALAGGYDVIIMERSLQTDRLVFAQMLKDEGKISDIEFAVYTKWFDSFQTEIPPCHIVYLHTTPEIAFERVLRRAREGEDIPIDYLAKCHSYHERWLGADSLPCLVLDATQDTLKDGGAVAQEWRSNIKKCVARLLAGAAVTPVEAFPE